MTIKSTKPSAADLMRRTLQGQPDEEPAQWYDIAIEQHRRHQEFEAQRERKRQAEEQAALPTTAFAASVIRQNARPSSGAMPLNGSRVLEAVASEMGTGSTIESRARESAAGLIRQGLIGSVQDGRNE